MFLQQMGMSNSAWDKLMLRLWNLRQIQEAVCQNSLFTQAFHSRFCLTTLEQKSWDFCSHSWCSVVAYYTLTLAPNCFLGFHWNCTNWTTCANPVKWHKAQPAGVVGYLSQKVAKSHVKSSVINFSHFTKTILLIVPRVYNSKSVQLPYGFYTNHLDRMT